MIQPVIVAVQANWDSVHRLVDYIAKLDGTVVKVLHLKPEDDATFSPMFPHNAKACRAAFSLYFAAIAMRGQPFIWLEHDSVPLKKGWAEALSAEYAKLGKPFMLSSDSNPPHDLVGGIGVYGPETHWMIPQHFREAGWDLWMLKNLGPMISKTPLIQHSYGIYNHGIAVPHSFPRDAKMLRKDAAIFHRDANHTLLKEGSRTHPGNTFWHSGDMGDVIYHMETIRCLGGGKLILGSHLGLGPNLPSHCREPMTKERVALLRPLLEAQGYIAAVEHSDKRPEPTWINLNSFRETFKPRQGSCWQSLQRASLYRFGLQPQNECRPWLHVDSPATNRICVARSPRYHNDAFPWKEIVERYHDKIDFIGLLSEWKDFQQFGQVPYIATPDLLSAAKVINSHSVFIGNQSCPYAISEGLKKPCVQETWATEPNCLFERPNTLQQCTNMDTIRQFIESHL